MHARDSPAVLPVDGLILAGIPRVKLERALGIGCLEWPDSARPRRVEALAQRIESGSVDLLLILRSYVQHTDANKLIDAARATGRPFALVDVGYGVEAMKAAIGDALGDRQRGVSA